MKHPANSTGLHKQKYKETYFVTLLDLTFCADIAQLQKSLEFITDLITCHSLTFMILAAESPKRPHLPMIVTCM